MEKNITYNEMPDALAYLITKVEAIDRMLKHMMPLSTEKKEVKWLNVEELCEYLPSHPREQTVYSWTSSRKIPFHKKGRSIMFNKREIDEWLQDSSHYKSEKDLEEEAREFITSKKKRRFN